MNDNTHWCVETEPGVWMVVTDDEPRTHYRSAHKCGTRARCRSCEHKRMEPQSFAVPASHGDDFENWTTERVRIELDNTQRILQNKRRYQLTQTTIAAFSVRRVRLEQVLLERAVTEMPRRGRAKSGTTFGMGREPGHPWPLEYLPRWPGDHHPWRIATTSGNGIRFACHEVEESDVLDRTDIQPENSSD